VLDTFRSAYDPMLHSWLRFRAHIVPEAGASAVTAVVPDDVSAPRSQHGVWRLLATNNRELARGVALHASPGLALVDAEVLQQGSAALTTHIVRGASSTAHGWLLRREGVAAVMCARWYESAADAAAAARGVRAVLSDAVIVRSVNIGTRSGRRHRHAVVPMDAVG
jgi:hypothetical protein